MLLLLAALVGGWTQPAAEIDVRCPENDAYLGDGVRAPGYMDIIRVRVFMDGQRTAYEVFVREPYLKGGKGLFAVELVFSHRIVTAVFGDDEERVLACAPPLGIGQTGVIDRDTGVRLGTGKCSLDMHSLKFEPGDWCTDRAKVLRGVVVIALDGDGPARIVDKWSPVGKTPPRVSQSFVPKNSAAARDLFAGGLRWPATLRDPSYTPKSGGPDVSLGPIPAFAELRSFELELREGAVILVFHMGAPPPHDNTRYLWLEVQGMFPGNRVLVVAVERTYHATPPVKPGSARILERDLTAVDGVPTMSVMGDQIRVTVPRLALTSQLDAIAALRGRYDEAAKPLLAVRCYYLPGEIEANQVAGAGWCGEVNLPVAKGHTWTSLNTPIRN